MYQKQPLDSNVLNLRTEGLHNLQGVRMSKSTNVTKFRRYVLMSTIIIVNDVYNQRHSLDLGYRQTI